MKTHNRFFLEMMYIAIWLVFSFSLMFALIGFLNKELWAIIMFCLFLFGGIALVIYVILLKRAIKNEKNKEL